MSHHYGVAIHPRTGEVVENAVFLDGYYERGEFGVQFPDGEIFRASEVPAPPGVAEAAPMPSHTHNSVGEALGCDECWPTAKNVLRLTQQPSEVVRSSVALMQDFIKELNYHISTCPMDSRVCVSCSHARKTLSSLQRLMAEAPRGANEQPVTQS